MIQRAAEKKFTPRTFSTSLAQARPAKSFSTRNSRSSRNASKLLKTNTRERFYPERPDRAIGELFRRSESQVSCLFRASASSIFSLLAVRASITILSGEV